MYLHGKNKGVDQLGISAFVFAYAKGRFSHSVAHMVPWEALNLLASHLVFITSLATIKISRNRKSCLILNL